MKKSDVVQTLLKTRDHSQPFLTEASAFAPANIALCKYWGKRDAELNLPLTSSLSVSLGQKGATTELVVNDKSQDSISLNGAWLAPESVFSQRLVDFLNVLRADDAPRCDITISSNIPIAAGLASSASGFAALVLAVDKLFAWQLQRHELSILARLGSGSASRSLWDGFVEWQMGSRPDGMDSHGEQVRAQWPEFCIGLLIFNTAEKLLSSRTAMQRTVTTSSLYKSWPMQVNQDLMALKQAILRKDFPLLGKTAESNALSMHATMMSAWPPIIYSQTETLLAMQKVWDLRAQGLEVYFTQDAGPNLKLLFLNQDVEAVQSHFPAVEIIQPFLC